MSPSTLQTWISGRAYEVASGSQWWNGLIERPDPGDSRLSFSNLIEAYVLNALRKNFNVPVPAIRTAIIDAEKYYEIPHFLRSEQLRAAGGNVYLEHLGKLINVGRGRQDAMPEILDEYLKRIEWSTAGFATRLFPVTRAAPNPAVSPHVVLIDPYLAFGRPVVRSKAIKTATISERFVLGESVLALAEDYDLEISEVEEAIRYERRALAA